MGVLNERWFVAEKVNVGAVVFVELGGSPEIDGKGLMVVCSALDRTAFSVITSMALASESSA